MSQTTFLQDFRGTVCLCSLDSSISTLMRVAGLTVETSTGWLANDLNIHRDRALVLIDCCTLWLTNFLSEDMKDIEEVKREFDRFTSQDATFIFVTNEIGMGGTSANALQRKFIRFS